MLFKCSLFLLLLAVLHYITLLYYYYNHFMLDMREMYFQSSVCLIN